MRFLSKNWDLNSIKSVINIAIMTNIVEELINYIYNNNNIKNAI